MRARNANQEPHRQDRLIQERVHDTYKLHGKLSEPARCPDCGAVYLHGRWQWVAAPPKGAEEVVCSACHRIRDNYPAGEVTLSGSFVAAHRDELMGIARNLEQTEKGEHSQNRIIAIRETGNEMLITTTDVHLPRRIGKAIEQAFEGKLDIHFDKDGYFTSITWHRDA